MNLIKEYKKIHLQEINVDDALVSYVKENGGIVATIDIALKGRIKETGGTVLSIANDRIVLEPSKT